MKKRVLVAYGGGGGGGEEFNMGLDEDGIGGFLRH